MGKNLSNARTTINSGSFTNAPERIGGSYGMGRMDIEPIWRSSDRCGVLGGATVITASGIVPRLSRIHGGL